MDNSCCRLMKYLLGTSLLATAQLYASDIPLTVSEPSGMQRKHEVVSGGIPFPEGKYKDPAAFSLFAGAGEIPVQISPMVKYPDGSLHWALVSFPASLEATNRLSVTLKDSAGTAKPANPVTVREDGNLVEVSNGLVAFAVNKAEFNGFEWIKHNGKLIFKSAKAGLTANSKGGPAKPTYFGFAYRGPVRTTLHVKGVYGDLKAPTFAMTITMNAGESAIRIEHNIRNGGIGAENTTVNFPQFRLGVAQEITAAAGGKSKGSSYGWQEFSGPEDLLVFVRHGGHAGWKGGPEYSATVTNSELAVNLAFRGDALSMEQATHKLTEITLSFGKSASVTQLAAPLHALAPCAWYAANDGMGIGRGFGSLEDETGTYKTAGWSKYDDPKKKPGMGGASDLWINALDVHNTTESDQLQGMLFGYIRTGQRGYLDQALALQRYYRTQYFYRSDDFINGREAKQLSRSGFGVTRCCAGGCHTYGVGLFNFALLDGSVDALEAAFDLAEQCYAESAVKPGSGLGFWGSRGPVRNYLGVARAADVARNREWMDRLVHMVNVIIQASDRDGRGFINHGWTTQNAQKVVDDHTKGGDMPEAVEMAAKDGVKVKGWAISHPVHGTNWMSSFSSWVEAMEAQGHMIAYEALSGSTDAVYQVAADDALDGIIVKSQLGLHYVYDPVQKCCHYKMLLDYPVPGYCPIWKGGKWKERIPKWGSDSWYTKFWPNPMAAGYSLTGDRRMRERMMEMLWWGLSREYVNPPVVPEGEAPPYSRIDTSTKGDFMTPTALAFGTRTKSNEVPPSAVNDLKATPAGAGRARLTWTAPAAAAGSTAKQYQLKYSTSPLDDYPETPEQWQKNWKNARSTVTYWNMAKNAAGEPFPAAPGKTEEMTLDVPAGKKVYFALRTFDSLNNRSGISNIAETEIPQK